MSASRSRVVTEPLGGSALSLAVQQRQLPGDMQPWWPRDAEEWQSHVRQVRASISGGWYHAIRPAIAPHGAAAARLGRVVAEGGVVVTAGQQAALFGGPLYTLNKALTALGLADALQQELGVAVAPVFWAATDDADFLEASITHVADAEGLHRLAWTNKPPPGIPMSRAPLGEMTDLLEQLRKACGSAAHATYFELSQAAFTNEPTLGDAYVRLLRDLLEPLGVSVLDSSHPAYTTAAHPVLVAALERAPEIARASAERAAAMRKLGFEPQVEDERGLSLVAVLENSAKRRVPVDGVDKVLKGRALDTLAPNVLLRPVVERAILPTVAYVAGPAELAYFAQSSAVARALATAAPVGVPRWSCTIVEPFVAKALERLGVEYHELHERTVLERRLAIAALPRDVSRAWNAVRTQVQDSVRALGDAVGHASLMPPEVVQGLERSLVHKLSRAERRLLAAVKRRDERVRQDLRVAADALFPLGHRQERVLNYVPMLTRGGPDLVDDMRAAALGHAKTLVRAETVSSSSER